ncbi:MAG: serine/threonine-protein kinase, partial [Phycisphaerales bacterium]|nr:serine/threonine-protein kinase [Phycisphaerales bacterium]
GRYKLRRIIGEGGMGVVYEAVQQSPRRTVALKMIRRGVTSRSALRRFAYEAQTLGRLHHEGIAQIYEADTYNDGTGEVPWFAMEYIAGAKPLTVYANDKGFGTRERLALFTKVCEAISHGHQKGIIHRDLKPGNILVDVNGQPKIIDYGIARATDSDMAVTTLQTDVGQLLGTVQYMSPEQCAADPDILDTRSDVYSLGVILYELLCEGYPYDLANVPVFEAARVIREKDPVRPSTINRTLRGDIETIVLKALQKDRDQRYQSAHELQQDIQRYLDNDPISARPPSLTYQVKVFARRNRALFLSTAAILVVLIAATIVSLVMAINASRSAADARAAEAEVLLKQERLQASQMYLIHVLAIPTPSIAQGRDLDHTDLLRIAGEDIDEWFAGMPGYQDDHHALIGYFMVKMGMHDEAEKHLLPALARLEAQHGRDHYKTQFSLITLAKMRNGQGHPREADELSAEVEAWVRAKETWGPMDIEFLIYRLEILDALTRWFDVVTLAEDALNRLQEVTFERAADGFTQEEIELALKGFLGRNLARSSQLQMDNERRQKMFERGFELLQEVIQKAGALAKMGPRHPVTLASRTDLTICNWGSSRTSYEEVQEALDELKLVHGPENPLVLQYELLVANILVNKGQFALGEELSRHCMESLESQLDPDHPSIHTAKLALGRSLAQQEKHEEAVLLLRDSIELLTERL